MAISLSSLVRGCGFFLALVQVGIAATVTYDFNVTWVLANPDGLMVRPVIGVNNQWPLPMIQVNKGDQLVVHVQNLLGNQSTSFHWHGMYQNGTTDMDGPVQVVQCPIAPGASFTYNFTVNQVGTYWYHSHNKGQYPDGQRGPLIVHDPDFPFKNEVDGELVLTLSDWYHQQMPDLLAKFISVTNPTGAEPVPKSALQNDTQNLQIKVEPGKTYHLRIVNMAAFAAQYFWIEGHTMRIVEVDGIYTEPAEATMLYLTAAQRYSVLVTMKNDTSKNYPIVGSMDEDLFDKVPDDLNPNVTSFLVYDSGKAMPAPADVDSFDFYDDFDLTPYDHMKLLDKADYSMTLTMAMDNLGDGANYAFFNDVTYVRPKVPTLITALTTGEAALNATVYGVNTNAFVLTKGQTVEIILNNNDPGKHPFHLHGHAFQVIYRSDDDAGDWDGSNVTQFHQTPMRRDTVMVHPNGNMILRFTADNPGVWLFHCHLEWHFATGLAATMIEAPLELQKTIELSVQEIQLCRDSDVPYAGNAAGNTENVFDLSGAFVSPAPLPAGFTTKGVVALVFSIVAALLGLTVITLYGMAPLRESETAHIVTVSSSKLVQADS